MPPRGWEQRVEDILESISRIRRYTAGQTFEQFSADEKTIDAVIRNIMIIGEAARSIPADVQSLYPDLPWSEMRRIRNLVVHEYFGVDIDILWKTIQNDLPPLVPRLRALLSTGN